MTTFRLHYDDGSTLEVDAETPGEARAVGATRRTGRICKVKVVREKADD
jgi:hypothetical protein